MMNTQIYDEASAWLVDFRTEEVDSLRRRRFERWLAVSPEHVRAYLELTALWEQAGAHAASNRTLDVDMLISAARAESNVVAVSGAAATSLQGRQARHLPGSRRQRMTGWQRYPAAAVVALVVLAGGLAAWSGMLRDPVYVTEVAEHRSIRLGDGSTVDLGPQTRIRVRFTADQRRIELLAGQALFTVAKAANRPFTVNSGQTSVRAVGTAFDVYRKRAGTVVTVLEGRVAVLGAPAESGSMELVAGQQITVTAAAMSQPVTVTPPDIRTWTHQPLVFEGAPLAEVADEFNRYHTQRIVLEGAELEDFHVSGTFPVSDPQTLPRFVDFLRNQKGLQVTESPGQIIVQKK